MQSYFTWVFMNVYGPPNIQLLGILQIIYPADSFRYSDITWIFQCKHEPYQEII